MVHIWRYDKVFMENRQKGVDFVRSGRIFHTLGGFLLSFPDISSTPTPFFTRLLSRNELLDGMSSMIKISPIHDETSLLHKVSKARYFLNGPFLDAKLDKVASYTWKGIWEARIILKEGCRWHGGDGKSVDIRADYWIQKSKSKGIKFWYKPRTRITGYSYQWGNWILECWTRASSSSPECCSRSSTKFLDICTETGYTILGAWKKWNIYIYRHTKLL